jgi:hypothetical protein
MAMPCSPIAAAQNHASPGRAALADSSHAVGHQPDAGGVDEDAVAAALFHHLGVAGDDLDSGRARRPRQRIHHAPQVGHGQPFLQNERHREKAAALRPWPDR